MWSASWCACVCVCFEICAVCARIREFRANNDNNKLHRALTYQTGGMNAKPRTNFQCVHFNGINWVLFVFLFWRKSKTKKQKRVRKENRKKRPIGRYKSKQTRNFLFDLIVSRQMYSYSFPLLSASSHTRWHRDDIWFPVSLSFPAFAVHVFSSKCLFDFFVEHNNQFVDCYHFVFGLDVKRSIYLCISQRMAMIFVIIHFNSSSNNNTTSIYVPLSVEQKKWFCLLNNFKQTNGRKSSTTKWWDERRQ